MLDFNGTDAATTTTDRTQRHPTITFNSGAELDTAVKKFGTAALKLNGTTGFLSLAAHAD